MRVILNDTLYGMTRKQFRGTLKVASKAIPFGIYAIEKDGICELKKEKYENLDDLRKQVAEYTVNGFRVYYNPKEKEND